MTADDQLAQQVLQVLAVGGAAHQRPAQVAGRPIGCRRHLLEQEGAAEGEDDATLLGIIAVDPDALLAVAMRGKPFRGVIEVEDVALRVGWRAGRWSDLSWTPAQEGPQPAGLGARWIECVEVDFDQALARLGAIGGPRSRRPDEFAIEAERAGHIVAPMPAPVGISKPA